VNLLMEGTPSEVDLGQVTREITGTERVTGVHDLHVWALSSEQTALSVHVVVGECPLSDAEHLVRDLEQRLCNRFDIGHTTIQVESCHPCGEIEHGAGAHNHPHDHSHEHVRLVTKSSAAPRVAGSGGPAR
jgi:cobalt-zinc-cadmium efflux system protein